MSLPACSIYMSFFRISPALTEERGAASNRRTAAARAASIRLTHKAIFSFFFIFFPHVFPVHIEVSCFFLHSAAVG